MTKPSGTLRQAGGVLSACVAVWLAAAQADSQLPVVDLSDSAPETLIPPEFEGGYFHRIGAMAIRDDGLWVLDAGHRRVFRFDAGGRLVVAFGRQGNGPGEFDWPSALRIDSVVTIPDVRQVRVSRFTLDGEHLETRRVGGPVVPSAGLAVLRSGVTVYVTSVQYIMNSSGIEGDPRAHVTVGFAGSSRSDTIASWHGASVMWTTASGTMSLFRTGFGRSGAWTTMGDSAIVVADGITGTISVFTVADSPRTETDTPRLSVDSVTMGIAGLPVTKADRERAEADFRRDRPNVRGQVTFEDWPSHWSVAIILLVSDDGKVWARRAVHEDERQHWTEVDLYGASSAPLHSSRALRASCDRGRQALRCRPRRTGCSARGVSGSPVTTRPTDRYTHPHYDRCAGQGNNLQHPPGPASSLHARLIATAAVLTMSAVAGCSSDTVDESVVGLRPFASSSAPFSTSVDVAMVSEEVACVIDSFESRIHCVDHGGRAAGVFGREGEAPGEFRGLTGIARGPDGLLGAVEFGAAQLTFFEPDGTLVSETRLPPGFQGDVLHGDRLFGIKLTMLDRERREGLPDYVPMEVDAFSGETLWERSDLADAVGLDCFTGVGGIPTPDGGLVFPACKYELAFLDHRDAATATVVASPAYFEALPNERDVDAYVNAVAGIGRRAVSLSPAQREAYAAGFREEPKDWFLRPASFNFDAENRLWAAITRDRDAFSYFEVWTGTEYAGTVRIRDRLMGYDILGSTLAALVERPPDRNGIAPRAIDWYDIGAVEFGRDE